MLREVRQTKRASIVCTEMNEIQRTSTATETGNWLVVWAGARDMKKDS